MLVSVNAGQTGRSFEIRTNPLQKLPKNSKRTYLVLLYQAYCECCVWCVNAYLCIHVN